MVKRLKEIIKKSNDIAIWLIENISNLEIL